MCFCKSQIASWTRYIKAEGVELYKHRCFMLRHSESIYEDTCVITFEILVHYPVTTLQVKTCKVVTAEWTTTVVLTQCALYWVSKACCKCLVGGDNSGPWKAHTPHTLLIIPAWYFLKSKRLIAPQENGASVWSTPCAAAAQHQEQWDTSVLRTKSRKQKLE